MKEKSRSKIPSKWVWIRDKLLELALPKLAEYADKIEAILRRLYGNTITEWWLEGGEYESCEEEFSNAESFSEKLDILLEVVYSDRACIACQVEVCATCRFARTKGVKYFDIITSNLTYLDENENKEVES